MPVSPLPDQAGSSSEPVYCTIEQLRTALGVDRTALSDQAALDLILTAEDLIDQELGARLIDEDTGRRVVQADVDAWRWDKLTRATVQLAAALHTTPDLAGQRWRSVSGPDFSMSGPIGTTWPPTVIAALDASGLRRLGARASVRHRSRGWRGVLLDDGTWDDEEVWTP